MPASILMDPRARSLLPFSTLIVEGSDKSGKTTLIKKIFFRLMEKRFPFSYVHYGLLPKAWDYSSDYVMSIANGRILDRFIDSEIVYGTVLRGQPQLTVESETRIRKHMGRCLTVYCRCTPGTLIQRAAGSDDQHLTDRFSKIAALYDEIYGFSGQASILPGDMVESDVHLGAPSLGRNPCPVPRRLLTVQTDVHVPDVVIESICAAFQPQWDGLPTTVTKP